METTCLGYNGFWRTDEFGLRWDVCFGCPDCNNKWYKSLQIKQDNFIECPLHDHGEDEASCRCGMHEDTRNG